MHGQAERRVTQSLLVSALEACSEPVEITDLEGLILFVNDSWCELFGINGADAPGRSRDSLGIDNGPVALEEASHSLYVREGPDGQPVAFIRIYEAEDSPTHDIRAGPQPRTRRLAHMLRNLLTAIQLSTELAERPQRASDKQEVLSLIQSAAAGCVDLLDEMEGTPKD